MYMKQETEVWLSIAKEDYKNMCAMKESQSLRGAVLFAQQCVEKIIKAYIAEYGLQPPKKIHHLEKLIEDTNLDIKEIGSPELHELSKAYGWVRYVTNQAVIINCRKSISMGIEQIQGSLKALMERLKAKYTPEQIILFGSYAKGTADAASDVDLLVVSPLFKNRDMYDIYSELYGLTSDFEKDVQIFGVSKEDILKYSTFRQAVKTGIILS